MDRPKKEQHNLRRHIYVGQTDVDVASDVCFFVSAAGHVTAASGTSIRGEFYLTLIEIKVHSVKRRGPVSRFGLKLDVWSLEST